MDEQTTQIAQRMQSGGLSRAGAVDELKKLQKQAADNKISNKGLLDLLKTFLEKVIAAPILAIYKLIKNSFLFGGKGGVDAPDGGGAKSTIHRAFGGPVDGGQRYMVGEAGPEMFTPRSGGQITPNNMLGHSGSGGTVVINNKISVTNDERAIKAAFDKAHRDTLSIVKRAKQKAN
jgi:hypothetical protein